MTRLHAPNSETALPSCWRVGDYLVDLAVREVSDPIGGRNTRITDKAKGVLLALIEADGRVMSREALIERVWAGTCPTGDVLTQAITALRKAFGDDASDPRYIETIAKTGYRLLAKAVPVLSDASDEALMPPLAGALPVATLVPDGESVATIATSESNGNSAPVLPAASRRPVLTLRRAWPLVVVVAALLVLYYWIGFAEERGAQRQAPEIPLEQSIQIIAATPENEYRPRLSPDGKRVVYVQDTPDRASSSLVVQTAEVGGVQLRVTEPIPGRFDQGPVFSNDGETVIFIRQHEDKRCLLMSVSALGGPARELTPCPPSRYLSSMDVDPGGRYLVTVGAHPSGANTLMLYEFAQNRWTHVNYRFEVDEQDYSPRFSPDGRLIAFHRGFSASDVWVVPTAGGEPTRLTERFGDIRGLDWMPDGQRILFSIQSNGPRELLLVDRQDRQIRKLMSDNAMFVDVAAKSRTLVLERVNIMYRLRRVDLDSGESLPLFPSSGSELQGAMSPAGDRLAFYSDRSGRLQLWFGGLQGEPAQAVVLPDYEPVPRYAPHWSGDGRRLMFVAHVAGEDQLIEVDVERLRARRLAVPVDKVRFGVYVGAHGLLVGGASPTEGQLHLFLRDGDRFIEQRHRSRVASAQYDAVRDRIVFTKVAHAGLFAMDTRFEHEQTLLPKVPGPVFYRRWFIQPSGEIVLLAQDSQGEYLLRALPVATKTSAQEYRLLSSMRMVESAEITPADSPNALLVSSAESLGRDIGLSTW